MRTTAALLAPIAAIALLLALRAEAVAQTCTPCTSCDTDYTDRHGADNPAAYQAEKQLFLDVFTDTVATSGVATWPQARAVWRALGERFRKQNFAPEDYIGSCTSCSCKKTNWCTEFVIRMYIRAGLTVLGTNSNNPVPSSRALFKCVRDKYSGSSAVYYRKPDDTSFTPRPGDALIFQWTGYRVDDGNYNGVDCRPHHDPDTHTADAGYCSDHTGMVLGVVGADLYTVEGNVSSGRIRVKRYTDYRNSDTIVAFMRINTGTLDCR